MLIYHASYSDIKTTKVEFVVSFGDARRRQLTSCTLNLYFYQGVSRNCDSYAICTLLRLGNNEIKIVYDIFFCCLVQLHTWDDLQSDRSNDKVQLTQSQTV